LDKDSDEGGHVVIMGDRTGA